MLRGTGHVMPLHVTQRVASAFSPADSLQLNSSSLPLLQYYLIITLYYNSKLSLNLIYFNKLINKLIN